MGADKIIYDQYIMSKKEEITFYFFTASGLFLIGFVFYKSVIISLLVSLLSIKGRKIYIRKCCEKRRKNLQMQFKDFLYSLSSSISSGRQMKEAMEEAKVNLAYMYKEDEPIMKEVNSMNYLLKSNMLTEEQVLEDWAKRSEVEEIISLWEVYSICKLTGADLASMIVKTSEVLMDKLAIEREIQAITWQKKYESKIIGSMPIIILILLNIISPDYLEKLYTTIEGKLIMTLALLIVMAAFYVMDRILEFKV